jgi:pimeloyl-ACP methyl ester carboxylesterase
VVRLREKAAGVPIPVPRSGAAGSPAAATDPDYMAEEFQQLHLARRDDPVPLGDRPLFVLAAGRRSPPPPGTDEALWREIRDEKDAQGEDLASLSRNARFIRDPDSGHAIHADDPRLVAEAIAAVVTAARAGGRLK